MINIIAYKNYKQDFTGSKEYLELGVPKLLQSCVISLKEAKAANLSSAIKTAKLQPKEFFCSANCFVNPDCPLTTPEHSNKHDEELLYIKQKITCIWDELRRHKKQAKRRRRNIMPPFPRIQSIQSSCHGTTDSNQSHYMKL